MWTYATHFLCDSCVIETPLHLLAECPHANRCQDCEDDRPCRECINEKREDAGL